MMPGRFLETDDYIEESLSNPLKILFQDEHLIAVFKPAGLLVHRSTSTLPHESILLQAFGLNSFSAAKMVQMFTDRFVDKYYQALVCGFTPDRFVVDRPLEERFNFAADQASEVDNPTQDAKTEFSVIEQYELPWETNEVSACQYSLLEIKPLTGRSHQIRRHLHHASCPIVGDHRHGNDEQNRWIFQKTGVYRMLLTAVRLDFRHPYTGELLTIATGRGSEFDRVVSYMRQFGSKKRKLGDR
jgi:tRNA pseudouridine65 synthase